MGSNRTARNLGLVVVAVLAGTLGSVDIHLSQMMAPTRDSMDANESAVFS